MEWNVRNKEMESTFYVEATILLYERRTFIENRSEIVMAITSHMS